MSYASGSEKLSFLDLRFGLAPLKMLEFTGQKSLTSKKHTADFCLTAKLRRAMARACPSTAPTPAVLATCWEALWPSAAPGQASTSGPTDYFVDLLFRPGSATATASGQRPASDTVGIAPAGTQPALSSEARAEITRILARSVGQGRLEDSDRAYLTQVVAARTGLSPDEAQRRIGEVETKARDAADKVTKAGAYFSFWAFMALLFGGAAATLGGILGGQLRDADIRAR